MVFSSVVFIFIFLPTTLILYKLASFTKNIRLQNVVLLICSLVFYAWGGLQYFFLLLVLLVINYLCGLWIAGSIHKRLPLIVSLMINIGTLFVFKYFNFFISNLEQLQSQFSGQEVSFGLPQLPLPIGISFFTFQIISYLIDLYRGQIPVQKNILNLMLYVVMFPQLIAGPIVRYTEIETAIHHRETSAFLEKRGLQRFILGLSKKVLLADSLGIFVNIAFAQSSNLNVVWAWLGAICYTLQIYIDFSGYSDMAIGLGQVFGFHFNENFNYPYTSKSIQEFWRRWHISLSSWFRDYVYIPLGGSRCAPWKIYRNLLIVFILTGIWHGAAWQFLIWGLYHGLFLILERLGLGKFLEKLPAVVRHLYTLVVVIIGFVFFRADSLPQATSFILRMFTFNLQEIANIQILSNLSGAFLFFLLLSVIISMPVFVKVKKVRFPAKEAICSLLSLLLLGISICFIVSTAFNPFIYFKF